MSLAIAVPLSPSVPEDAPGGARRRRWQVWKSPEGQPGWARPALLGIAAVAALQYARNLTQAGFSPFYSVAVKSMSESWKAFFYGAFDPRATITIDKLAGSFLPQAMSARIFGFHAWSLALPQVIEGVISVLVMYRVVRRWTGVVPGLLAAGIFTLTPVAASMFGHSMEDGALTMCLVLAADSYQRAVLEGRLRSLVWAGVWIGVGFQAKMLQAWMALPALGLGYLLTAPGPLRRRAVHLGAAGAAMLAVSLSWIALYTFTPANDRPYVDGSTDNSAVTMVFGYNGLERFGVSVPGSVRAMNMGGRHGDGFGSPPSQRHSAAGQAEASQKLLAAAGFGRRSGGGWGKLFGARFGPEVGWLDPLAVLALIFGLAWLRRARRDDPVRGGFVFWGAWLVTFGLIFSKMSSIPHTAYVASLALPLAALPAAGIMMFWRLYRSGDGRGWVLPLAVGAELAWVLYLWRGYGGFLPWARTAAVVAGVAAVVVMAGVRLISGRRAWVVTAGLAACGVGVAAMLAAPATWAGSVLDARYAGSSMDAGAGPAEGMNRLMGNLGGAVGSGATLAGGQAARVHGMPAAAEAHGPTGVPGMPAGRRTSGFAASLTLSSAGRRIYGYVSAHRDGAGYLMAVQSWSTAAPYILSTGQEVMPIGGFSGTVPQPTLAKVQHLTGTGQLRFFLLNGTGSRMGSAAFMRGSSAQSRAIVTWVQRSCAKVPVRTFGTTAGTLYRCATRAA